MAIDVGEEVRRNLAPLGDAVNNRLAFALQQLAQKREEDREERYRQERRKDIQDERKVRADEKKDERDYEKLIYKERLAEASRIRTDERYSGFVRKKDESDEEFVERVNKGKAEGPNRMFELRRATQSRMDKLIQTEIERRQKLVESAARSDPAFIKELQEYANGEQVLEVMSGKTDVNELVKVIGKNKSPDGAVAIQIAYLSAVAAATDRVATMPASSEFTTQSNSIKSELDEYNSILERQLRDPDLNAFSPYLKFDPAVVSNPLSAFSTAKAAAAASGKTAPGTSAAAGVTPVTSVPAQQPRSLQEGGVLGFLGDRAGTILKAGVAQSPPGRAYSAYQKNYVEPIMKAGRTVGRVLFGGGESPPVGPVPPRPIDVPATVTPMQTPQQAPSPLPRELMQMLQIDDDVASEMVRQALARPDGAAQMEAANSRAMQGDPQTLQNFQKARDRITQQMRSGMFAPIQGGMRQPTPAYYQ